MDEIKKDYLELFDACCDYYKYVEKMSDDVDITLEEVEDIFSTILSDNMIIMYEGKKEIIDGIKFYKKIFDKIKITSNYSELVELIKYQYVDNINSPHLNSHYNMVIFCTKMTTHLTWKLSYELSPRLRSTPEEAIEDILYPIRTSQKEIYNIMMMLEKKYNVKIL